MPRKLISIVLIATMTTLGLTSAPARAGNTDADQWAKFFLGATVLAIIAHNANNKQRNKSYITTPQHPPYGYHGHPHKPRGYHDHAHKPRRLVLPAQCIRTFHVQGKNRRLMPQRCLKRNQVRLARLPDVCYRQLHTNRGFRQGYAPRCLRRNGYEFR